MTPADLVKSAADAINAGRKTVQLVLPRRATGRLRMRVFGGKGQRSLFGEVACENADGRTVVWGAARHADSLPASVPGVWVGGAGVSDELRRRTPGERKAYSDGYLSALRYAADADGVDEATRKKFRSLIEVHELFCRAEEEARRREVTP